MSDLDVDQRDLYSWIRGVRELAYGDGSVRAEPGLELELSLRLCELIVETASNHIASWIRDRDFEDLQIDGTSRAHPYTLYWSLQGLLARKQLGLESTTADVLPVVSEAQGRLAEIVATGTSKPERIDPFRLGFHIAVEMAAGELVKHPRNEHVVEAGLGLMTKLMRDGVWAKRDRYWATSRGDAYGFTPELLTSLLLALEGETRLIQKLEPALFAVVSWLERNWVPIDQAVVWPTSLGFESQTPEAWATSEIYSMLYMVERYTRDRLATAVQERWGGIRRTGVATPVDDLRTSGLARLDADIWTSDYAHRQGDRLGEILAIHVVEPLATRHPYFASYSLASLANRADQTRSGILFGPPGTGKTTFVEQLAETLGWPLIRIDPSDFLRRGTPNVPRVAREIFGDLSLLKDCVVLFDECEEFFRDRDPVVEDLSAGSSTGREPSGGVERRQAEIDSVTGPGRPTERPVPEQRLWTASFLTLLQDLHDLANVIFIAATNHYESMDTAVIRPGRFDFRVQVLPPSPRRKEEMLSSLVADGSRGQLKLDQAAVEVLESFYASFRPGTTLRGPVAGKAANLVAQDLRWAFMTRADVRALAPYVRSVVLEALAQGSRTIALTQADAILNRVVPVPFYFNFLDPSEYTYFPGWEKG